MKILEEKLHRGNNMVEYISNQRESSEDSLGDEYFYGDCVTE